MGRIARLAPLAPSLVLVLVLVLVAGACSTTPRTVRPAMEWTPSEAAPRPSREPVLLEDADADVFAVGLAVRAEDTAPQASHAPAPEAYPNMYRRMGISAGGAFFDHFDTTVQVEGEAGVGAILDLEDLLGVDDNTFVGRVDAFYAFSRRHRIDFSVYDIKREGTKVVGEDIDFGDVTIPSGSVKSTIDTLVIKAAYRYNFVTDERTTIGASFGFHTLGIDLGLDSPAFDVSETFRATAPLPVIGLHGEYALSKRWKLLASSEIFQIDLGFAAGFLADNRLALENDTFDHFGWGIALSGFRLDADIEGDSLTGDLEYAYQGALIYLRAYL